MKRFFNLFVLTQPEQRLVIVLVLLLAAGAWFKHYRDLQNTVRPQPNPSPTTVPERARSR